MAQKTHGVKNLQPVREYNNKKTESFAAFGFSLVILSFFRSKRYGVQRTVGYPVLAGYAFVQYYFGSVERLVVNVYELCNFRKWQLESVFAYNRYVRSVRAVFYGKSRLLQLVSQCFVQFCKISVFAKLGAHYVACAQYGKLAYGKARSNHLAYSVQGGLYVQQSVFVYVAYKVQRYVVVGFGYEPPLRRVRLKLVCRAFQVVFCAFGKVQRDKKLSFCHPAVIIT